MAPDRTGVISAKETVFQRGFKAWCENTSESLRRKLGKTIHEPLDPFELATTLGVEVWDISSINLLSKEALRHLSSSSGDEWSAVTVYVGTRLIVVLNPRHSAARKASNLMHELAHIIREHKPASMITSEAGFILRSFDERQEAEADWLAAALLLPRSALSYCQARSIPSDQLLADYGVSKQMLRYRMGVTGVSRQFKHRTG
jgi:Zn-dependent peptidase ImmA (M78 family)